MEQLEPAYLLHTRDYRDTSLLIDLFTPDAGRIGAVARGARRFRRGASQRGLLQPFRPLWVAWSGRGELRTLTAVESRAAPVSLAGYALFSGLYANELMQRLLHRDDPHPDLFAYYEAFLPALASLTGHLDRPLRAFELALLSELGYGVALDMDAYGQPLAMGGQYRFDAGHGLIPVAALADDGALFRGEDLCAFAAGDDSVAARRAAKRLCRMALQPHLGNRPLASRALFQP